MSTSEATYSDLAVEYNSALLAPAGGPNWCTFDPNGNGKANNQVTKDCCAAVRHRAYYNEAQHTCQGYGGNADNAVDTGAFVRCCGSRNSGSRGHGTTSNLVFAPQD
ncbi:hypothetical protein EJ06DRAFT_478589 [Trichodelitschia bisporula]|uniref:Uncharacterized protein n=1 Tax=Trichodelitschia bisporula TaxID=703511 RepID=A0A6G1HU20_9PEZI|nr:hypothetical protein EJ06DRAFT_478589 [Trichodelitschia bisporula]